MELGLQDGATTSTRPGLHLSVKDAPRGNRSRLYYIIGGGNDHWFVKADRKSPVGVQWTPNGVCAQKSTREHDMMARHNMPADTQSAR